MLGDAVGRSQPVLDGDHVSAGPHVRLDGARCRSGTRGLRGDDAVEFSISTDSDPASLGNGGNISLIASEAINIDIEFSI